MELEYGVWIMEYQVPSVERFLSPSIPDIPSYCTYDEFSICEPVDYPYITEHA